MKAIIWFDPGIDTGVAWGVFDERSQTVADAMRDKINSGSATILRTTDKGTTMEDLHATTIEMYNLWSAFKIDAVRRWCMKPEDVILGLEDFSLYAMGSSGKQGIWPAFLIGAFESYRLAQYHQHRPRGKRHFTDAQLQLSSAGMRYNKQKFLKTWDCWVIGKEHERAAYAHIGAYLHKILV